MQHGKYIVIEGTDGAGKSTQVELLRKYLNQQHIQSIEFHEPEDEALPITSALRAIIKDKRLERTPETNLLLFTAARHEIWHKRAVPALQAGTWVIAARSYISTLAYQGYGEGLDLERINALTNMFTDSAYMQPDGLIILTLADEKQRQKRIAQRDSKAPSDTFESRHHTFQKKITDGYLKLAKTMDIPTIEANASPNALHQKVVATLQQQIGTF